MPSQIPTIYRVAFTWFEPFSAIAGALQLNFMPKMYLEIAAPNAAPYFQPILQPVMTSIMGGWLLMAFNDIVTLRVFRNDVKLWRCIVAAHLVSDIVYGWSMAQDVGLATIVNPFVWTVNDWIMAVGTWPVAVAKVAFLLGIGVNSGSVKRD